MSRKRRPSSPARVSAISLRARPRLASSAKIASRPVPAEGSRTRSAGGDCGGFGGGKAERDRRRELLEAVRFPPSGGSATAAARQAASASRASRRREPARVRMARAEFAQEQHLRRLERLRRRPSRPRRLPRRCRRTRLPWRSAARGCRARGPGRAIARAGLRHEKAPTPCRGPGRRRTAATPRAWPRR